MKAILQRVSNAQVDINHQTVGSIQQGLVVLLGIEVDDAHEDSQKLLKKITELRIFSNKDGKFDHSLLDIKGDMLIISQFTLMADCKKGRRPSFASAAPPKTAKSLCDAFIESAKQLSIGHIATGEFGADMQVSLINDGPVTISLNSNDL